MWDDFNIYLGMYRTRSATTNPTVTNKFVAGKNGRISNKMPSISGAYR